MTAEIPEFGGCPWPIDPGCVEGWDTLDEAVRDRAVALASATLYRLTGYQVGGCPITVRPCKKGCAGSWPSYFDRYASAGMRAGFWPQNWGGVWINSCGCTTDCSCVTLCEVALPPPVGEVYAVTVGTEVLPSTDYRVDGSTLVWTGAGDCPWPTCQDLAAPVGAEGTFAVEYLNSYPVDALGAYAAGVLANEYAKACTGAKCRLPSSVTAVARQGVTFDVATGAFPNGMTGLREVDVFISLWNPQALRQRASVWSPDRPSPRVMR
jgi:hypothetical protein